MVVPCAVIASLGCDSGMQRIDRHTLELLEQGTASIHAETVPAWSAARIPAGEAISFRGDPPTPVTRNPRADQMDFTARPGDDDVLARITAAGDSGEPIALDLAGAVAYALRHGREYQTAAENYVIVALNLLIERHLWSPRFFDEMSATAVTSGSGGVFDASLNLVNELSVRQRLPYGGQVSASVLASAAEDLRRRVSDQSTQSASALLRADIPLLRGAGQAAREDRVQAERNLIYAAREFERFRREFYTSIATDYLDLIVRQQGIANAERQVQSFRGVEARERALVEAGRQTTFQAALAAQDTLFAADRLSGQIESYRLALDRFKIRLGMPIDTALEILPDRLGLPVPEVNIDRAVAIGLNQRLDLQTQRDRLEDSRRRVNVARNELLPDLDIFGSARIPTDPGKQRAGVDFSPEDGDYAAGILLSLPLDREIERARLRQAQIAYDRAGRVYSEARDGVAVQVRSVVREIDRAIFSLRLQEENVRIAEARQASIEAAPDRATARDRSDAVDAKTRAEDSLDLARRDLQVAVLRYLLLTDQLRIAEDGSIEPLQGMIVDRDDPMLNEPPPAPPDPEFG